MRWLRLTELICTAVCWGVPIGLAAFVAGIDGYGPPSEGWGGDWCWIKDVDGYWWVQMLTFYVPSWIILFFCIVMLILNYTNYRKYENILFLVLHEHESDYLERCKSVDRERVAQVPIILLIRFTSSLCILNRLPFQQTILLTAMCRCEEEQELNGVVRHMLRLSLVLGIIGPHHVANVHRVRLCHVDEIHLCSVTRLREPHRVRGGVLGLPDVHLERMEATHVCRHSQLHVLRHFSSLSSSLFAANLLCRDEDWCAYLFIYWFGLVFFFLFYMKGGNNKLCVGFK